jgi:hypothetical protein
MHTTKLIPYHYASEKSTLSHPFPLPLNKTEIYFYIICGRVFSYSSSDANNTYIITDQYMMDGSYSSDLLKL